MFDIKDFLAGKVPVMVFDVEAVGLHGEGFAVGYVVGTIDGIFTSKMYNCPPYVAKAGTQGDPKWIAQNVPIFHHTHMTPSDVREAFWADMQRFKQNNCIIAAECTWPVEANFLSACVEFDTEDRNWMGPYPFLDISPILYVAGINPQVSQPRHPEELPVHNPEKDARQSFRLFVEAVKKLHNVA